MEETARSDGQQAIGISGRSAMIGRLGKHRETIALASLGFVACLIVRLPMLGSRQFWLDEIITVRTIALDWVEVATQRLAAMHSPLYFWILKAVAPGDASEFWLRFPSVMFDALAGGIFAVVALRLAGRIGAVAMIVLYAFGPLQITYAQEARPYGLLMFFVAIAVLGFVLLLSPYRAAAGDGNAATPPRDTENSTAALAIATIGTAGAGLSIVGGWIVALAFQASLAIQPAATRRSLLRPWLVNVAITWVAILPFAVGIWRSLDKASASSWVETIRPLNVQTMLSMADGLFLRPGPSMAGLLAVAHAGANVALIGLAIVAVIAGRHRPAVRFLGFATLALPLLLLATSSVQSVLVERYFLPCIATFLLLSSLGVALAWPRRWMRIVIALLAVATALQGVRTVVRSERADYRPLASFLERNNVGGIAVISRIRHLKLELGHYLKSPLSLEVRTANALASDEIRKSLGANQGLWLLYRKSEAPVLDGAIPPEVVRCDWQYLDGRIEWRLILLASTRSDLPPRLRQCEPNNGAIPFPAGSGAMRGPPHG